MTATKDDGAVERREPPRLVEDVIAACGGTNSTRRTIERIGLVVLHRTSLSRHTPHNPHPVSDLLLDGPQLAKRFRNTGLGTGGQVPYHFLVLVDGTVQQLLPLTRVGSHAKGYNTSSIGVAVVGSDLERRAPLHLQIDALVRLVAVLRGLNGGLRVVGHTALPGASTDPGKVCPGPHIVPDEIDRRAASYLPQGYSAAHVAAALEQAGVVQ